MAFTHVTILLPILFPLYLFYRLFSHPSHPKNTQFPPGPPRKPFIGNLLDIPTHHSWLQFTKWADKYGPIFRLNIVGKEHCVVSMEKIANDLLRDRGSIYSSREQTPAGAKLLSGDLRPLLLPYNDQWRRCRKLMHELCMSKSATRYEPAQRLESIHLLRSLIQAPHDYEKHLERYASGLIFRIGFGKIIETGEEEILQRLIRAVHTVERVVSPGAYLVDTFPVLMYLPRIFAPFKRELEKLHVEELGLFRGLLDDVREQVKQGTAPSCWERTFIEKQDDFNLTDDQGAYVVGTLFEAGSATTAQTMMSFILAMLHHPEWQKRMQEEIDRAVGDTRLPDFGDMPNLPTVRAVVKETLRWRPVTAGGVPHQLVKDDVYDGFFLPAGTNIHPNQWAIHHDQTLYPSPEDFNPDRWLRPGYPTYREPLSQYPNLQNFSAFGFGRRICPGLAIAERSLNLLVARITWVCNICKKKDSGGREIEVPWYDYTDGFNVQPKWFPFELTVRGERGRLVEEEMKKKREGNLL